jgi:hypothetical protein
MEHASSRDPPRDGDSLVAYHPDPRTRAKLHRRRQNSVRNRHKTGRDRSWDDSRKDASDRAPGPRRTVASGRRVIPVPADDCACRDTLEAVTDNRTVAGEDCGESGATSCRECGSPAGARTDRQDPAVRRRGRPHPGREPQAISNGGTLDGKPAPSLRPRCPGVCHHRAPVRIGARMPQIGTLSGRQSLSFARLA